MIQAHSKLDNQDQLPDQGQHFLPQEVDRLIVWKNKIFSFAQGSSESNSFFNYNISVQFPKELPFHVGK